MQCFLIAMVFLVHPYWLVKSLNATWVWHFYLYNLSCVCKITWSPTNTTEVIHIFIFRMLTVFIEVLHFTSCKKGHFRCDVDPSYSCSFRFRYNVVFGRMSIGGRKTKLSEKDPQCKVYQGRDNNSCSRTKQLRKQNLWTTIVRSFYTVVHFVAKLLL